MDTSGLDEQQTHVGMAGGPESVQIRGARTHNLKNVDCDIPRGQLVVVTGPSGSGKSSLAFDTLFAEGQRQFMESMSLFSRQFFRQLPRPDVDRVSGIEPTLCLDQTRHRSTRRSTVGTITEIYDYLRLLMARAGSIHCSGCGSPIEQHTPYQIRDHVMALPAESKLMVLAPILDETGSSKSVIQQVRTAGLVRVRLDGDIFDIEQLPPLHPSKPHAIEAVTDRIIVRSGIEDRLLEAIDAAVRISTTASVTCCWLEKGQDRSGPWNEQTFSTRYACAECNITYQEVEPRSFSFNSPFGACPDCEGLGATIQFDSDLVLDWNLSLQEGAIIPWRSLTASSRTRQLAALNPVLKKHLVEPNVPLGEQDRAAVLRCFSDGDKQTPGIGIQLQKELATTSSDERLDELEAFQDRIVCSSCRGSRVNNQARSVFLNEMHIGHLVDSPIEGLAAELDQSLASLTDANQRSIAQPIVEEIQHRLKFLNKVGVGYLTLGRSAETLSGGEHQRVRLANSIGAGVTNVMFVLDEPSIGLHAKDTRCLIEAFQELRQQGNSLVVVEHDLDVVRAADSLIDMGPAAGERGGTIVAQGTPEDVAVNANSVTGKYLGDEFVQRSWTQKTRSMEPQRSIRIRQASGHNLRGIDVRIPLGQLVCVTGVSGSGKSTLVQGTLAPMIKRHLGLTCPRPEPVGGIDGLEQIGSVLVVDQKPIGRTPRACPATFCGLMDPIRKLFAATKQAKRLGFGAGRFSFNSKSGWCTSCRGLGHRKVEMGMMPDVFVTCDVCHGQRYNLQTLQVRFGGLNVAEVLQLSVDEARSTFSNFESLHQVLVQLSEVGLGYLRLGQSGTTLSGGEAQRIKLAAELSKHRVTLRGNVTKPQSSTPQSAGTTPVGDVTLYVLDEPTTGLHLLDVERLVGVLHSLVDAGNSVIVVEHHLEVMAASDWIIDLGPEGGAAGGSVVGEGTPQQISELSTHTGRELRKRIIPGSN
ncbi:MAG: excinuclease ABC subunit UvrA [Planctomycetota bacterium]